MLRELRKARESLTAWEIALACAIALLIALAAGGAFGSEPQLRFEPAPAVKPAPKVSPKPVVPPPDPKHAAPPAVRPPSQANGNAASAGGGVQQVQPRVEGTIPRPFMMPRKVLITGPDNCEPCIKSGRQIPSFVEVTHDSKSENARVWTERYGGPVFHFQGVDGKWNYLKSDSWSPDDPTKLLRAIDHKMRLSLPPVEFDNQNDLKVAAAVGALNLRSVFAPMLPVAKSVIGTGKIESWWYRPNGATKFSVIGGNNRDYSLSAIAGTTGGHIKWRAVGTNIPRLVSSYGTGYSILPGDQIRLHPDDLDLPRFGTTGAASSQPCGFFDAGLIFGGLNLILKACAFYAELEVDKNVEFTASMPGSVLVLDITKGVRTHKSLFWDSYKPVSRVEISESGLMVLDGKKRRTIRF